MNKIKLNNNLECPALGLGTYMLSPDEEIYIASADLLNNEKHIQKILMFLLRFL